MIGNSDYRYVAKLPNPQHDARLIAKTLRNLGFTIVGGGAYLNLDKDGFEAAVEKFGNALQGAKVGLFYYAGHGLALDGTNYLIPTDANPVKPADANFQLINANAVLDEMTGPGSGTRLNMMLLDACRNNPFAGRGLRAVSAGLTPMQVPAGTIVSFATQPDHAALDGRSGDSPYALALAKTIVKPGLDILHAFNDVGLLVKKETGGAQMPWQSSSPVSGNFYFAGAPATPKTVDEASKVWATTKDTTSIAELQTFIQNFGNTVYGSMARARLNELKQHQVAMFVPQKLPEPIPNRSRNALVTALQKELDRVGCDPGPIDGLWVNRTKQALERFNKFTKLALPTGVPTTQALGALKDAKKDVCPVGSAPQHYIIINQRIQYPVHGVAPEKDLRRANAALRRALQDGQRQTWGRPESGNIGWVVVGPIYYDDQRKCRTFKNSMYAWGTGYEGAAGLEIIRGIACEKPSG